MAVAVSPSLDNGDRLTTDGIRDFATAERVKLEGEREKLLWALLIYNAVILLKRIEAAVFISLCRVFCPLLICDKFVTNLPV